MLLPYLEKDALLRRQFLSRIRYMGSAGAGFPRNHWERIQQMVQEEQGHRILFATNWGATETAPTATAVHFDSDRPNNIGLPIPGVELRMVPQDGKHELRVRGPTIFPGYWRQPELTAASHDEHGFYRTGDAGKFIDPEHPELGIQFDGRVAEDFKLLSGTWVSVGSLRVRAVQAGSPVIQDVVVTGHDRHEIGLLVFPSLSACRALCPGLPANAGADVLLGQPEVRMRVQQALVALGGEATGSSMRPARALLMAEPPNPEGNEITEKGYLNQRAVLESRAADVARLYGDDPAVIHAAEARNGSPPGPDSSRPAMPTDHLHRPSGPA
jgi:feruloyl-CoA synthase